MNLDDFWDLHLTQPEPEEQIHHPILPDLIKLPLVTDYDAGRTIFCSWATHKYDYPNVPEYLEAFDARAWHITSAWIKHIPSTNNNLLVMHDTLGGQHKVWAYNMREVAVDMISPRNMNPRFNDCCDTLGLSFGLDRLRVQGDWVLVRQVLIPRYKKVQAFMGLYPARRSPDEWVTLWTSESWNARTYSIMDSDWDSFWGDH